MTVDTRLYPHLDQLPRALGGPVYRWLDQHWPAISVAPGSGHNHQAWPGGFLDHTLQLLALVDQLYPAISRVHRLPGDVTPGAAKLVLLFHDVEKPFKYTAGLPEGWCKWSYLETHLPRDWGIAFSASEWNALRYVHGEGDEYAKTARVMGPLASFCHSCDVLSARALFDRGAPEPDR